MPRARTPTLALLLAAGISVVGPNLIEPEPVAAPWSDTTTVAGPLATDHDSMNETDDAENPKHPEERSTTCHAS